jgi:hypothetical protein
MSVIATDVDAGTVPVLVDVKEPAIVTGGDAGEIPVNEHVVGGFVVDGVGKPETPVPAMEMPRSYKVLAARPVPVMTLVPPTLTTVGAAIRLVLSEKSMSPYCVLTCAPKPASVSK